MTPPPDDVPRLAAPGPLAAGTQVLHPRHGQGSVEFDRGPSVLVRFGGRIEECAHADLTLRHSLAETIEATEWDAALPVACRAMAHAIVSVNEAWGVFSRSRIALLPHQLWVCRRVIERWPARWLIADDVGLGKTIEAGLVLWPLLASGRVRRLLILCPAGLVDQWRLRLKNMFDIRVRAYHSDDDRANDDYWEDHEAVVASLETLRRDQAGRHQRMIESAGWDLVIVDEAHHLNFDEQGGPTLGYRLVSKLLEAKRVQSLLFFTGTPHRGKNYGFLALLQLLRPDLFDPDEPLPEQLLRLREAVIRNNKQSVTDLEGKRLFRAPIVSAETYAYSAEEARFYEMLTEFILSGKAYASTLGAADRRIVIFVLLAMQKLASSSVAAVRRALRRRLERVAAGRRDEAARTRELAARMEELDGEGGDDDARAVLEEAAAEFLSRFAIVEDEEPRLRELLVAADAVLRETKLAKLIELVDGRFAGRSILFFTEYKATQSLLLSALIARHGESSVAFINGDERAEEVIGADGRPRILRQTREEAAAALNSGSARFLVSTEAGGEGIDLQEQCHTLIHVDLPWNPMRLHQRVGRLNRYGQRDQVEVVTLRNPDTVESRIWDKLNEKLHSITLAFGHVMDQPEDLLQLVLGMTSPKLFQEIFADAAAVPRESLASWFDERTATFGGQDVVRVVREVVGNCARFDFQSVGQDVPRLDLPDLRPFLVGMLHLNRRRPRLGEDGALAFLTPESWLEGRPAVRPEYEDLVFDRGLKGRDALSRIVGVGHKLFDAAIEQACALTDSVAVVGGGALARPILVARLFDRLASGTASLRSGLLGAELGVDGVWRRLRDWEVVQKLGPVVEHVATARKAATAPSDRSNVGSQYRAGLAWLEAGAKEWEPQLRMPTVEPIALLWPAEEPPDGTPARR